MGTRGSRPRYLAKGVTLSFIKELEEDTYSAALRSFQGCLTWRSLAETLNVRPTSLIILGEPKHWYAIFGKKFSGVTLLEVTKRKQSKPLPWDGVLNTLRRLKVSRFDLEVDEHALDVVLLVHKRFRNEIRLDQHRTFYRYGELRHTVLVSLIPQE